MDDGETNIYDNPNLHGGCDAVHFVLTVDFSGDDPFILIYYGPITVSLLHHL
jgi:hypothetical protein